jgi:hypothetical protein
MTYVYMALIHAEMNHCSSLNKHTFLRKYILHSLKVLVLLSLFQSHLKKCCLKRFVYFHEDKIVLLHNISRQNFIWMNNSKTGENRQYICRMHHLALPFDFGEWFAKIYSTLESYCDEVHRISIDKMSFSISVLIVCD